MEENREAQLEAFSNFPYKRRKVESEMFADYAEK